MNNEEKINSQTKANEGKTLAPEKNRSGNRSVGRQDESRTARLRRRARRIAESLIATEAQKANRRAEILARADGIRRSADLV